MTLLSTYLPWLVDGENIVNPTRLARIGRLVNWVLKVRGWKAIGGSEALLR